MGAADDPTADLAPPFGVLDAFALGLAVGLVVVPAVGCALAVGLALAIPVTPVTPAPGCPLGCACVPSMSVASSTSAGSTM